MIVVKSLIIFMSLLIFTSCVTTESFKDLIKKPFQKTEEVSENDPKNVEILKKNVASKSKNESKEEKLIKEPKGKSNEGFCKELNQKFKVYGWHKIICNPDRWRVYDYSIEGNPLFYQELGFENKDKSLLEPANKIVLKPAN